jgi:hypothetical protein
MMMPSAGRSFPRVLILSNHDGSPADGDKPWRVQRTTAAWIAGALFWLRVSIWLVAPVTYLLIPGQAASGMLLSFLGASVLIGWVGGHTFWFPARVVAWACLLAYISAATGQWVYQSRFRWDVCAVLCALIFTLGSDVITVQKRRLYLPMLLGAAWPTARLVIAQNPDLAFVELLWPAGGIAALVLLGWPRDTDGMLRTSLDYWFGRVEIISWGMKKVLAVGLRRERMHRRVG